MLVLDLGPTGVFLQWGLSMLSPREDPAGEGASCPLSLDVATLVLMAGGATMPIGDGFDALPRGARSRVPHGRAT